MFNINTILRYLILTFFLVASSNILGKGNLITVCHSGDCKAMSISAALDLSNDGDKIIIQPGLYNESELIVTKKIHIQGIDYPIIDNQFKSNGIEIQSDGVTVEGLAIKNSKVSDIKEYAGIYLTEVSDVRVLNNKLENNAYGIYLEKSKNSLIQNNVSIGNALNEVSGGNGVHLWTSHGIK